IGKRVVGYYALAAGAVAHSEAAGRVRRNMPNPVPVMVLGRLAIDQSVQGHGLGPALLKDAILRTLQAAEIAGIRAILVHAISERVKRFYEKWGFITSPLDPMTLMITVAEARNALAQTRYRRTAPDLQKSRTQIAIFAELTAPFVLPTAHCSCVELLP